MTKYRGKYDILIENHITRYQTGGLMSGDIVKIRKDALKNEKVQKMMNNYKEMVKFSMETDLNLRVSAIKSIWPNSTRDYSGGQGYATDAAGADYWVDVVLEYAPGLYKDPMSVPMEILEIVDTGINLAPIPDSLKRPSITHLPKDIEAMDKDRKLPTKNTTMANSNSPKDGRDQAEKPKDDKHDKSGKLKKESTENKSDVERLAEAYQEIEEGTWDNLQQRASLNPKARKSNVFQSTGMRPEEILRGKQASIDDAIGAQSSASNAITGEKKIKEMLIPLVKSGQLSNQDFNKLDIYGYAKTGGSLDPQSIAAWAKQKYNINIPITAPAANQNAPE